MPAQRKGGRRTPAVKEIVHPNPIPPSVTEERYGGQWVAIHNRRVADHDFDLERLWRRLEKRGIADESLFHLVPPPGVLLI
jgi:hypothetical protein